MVQLNWLLDTCLNRIPGTQSVIRPSATVAFSCGAMDSLCGWSLCSDFRARQLHVHYGNMPSVFNSSCCLSNNAERRMLEAANYGFFRRSMATAFLSTGLGDNQRQQWQLHNASAD